MSDKEKTNDTGIDITTGIGIVKFKITRGDKLLYGIRLPMAKAADIGNGLLRAAAQAEVIEFLLKEAEACGMQDQLDELLVKSAERLLKEEKANDK